MPSVGIIGYNGQEVAKVLLRMCAETPYGFQITPYAPLDTRVNVLVATAASPILKNIVPYIDPNGYLVVNADDKAIIKQCGCSTAKLITYGFNTRACITASGVSDTRMQICIQRTFSNICGVNREPQEFTAWVAQGENSISVLGAAAAWAVLNPAGCE